MQRDERLRWVLGRGIDLAGIELGAWRVALDIGHRLTAERGDGARHAAGRCDAVTAHEDRAVLIEAGPEGKG